MKKIFFGIFILVFILLVGCASAWGVSSVYTRDNPLRLNPNGTTTITFNLQNLVGGEDLRIKAEVVNGTEYAEIIGADEYDLPLGSKDVGVNVMVTSPSQEGEYLIGIAFSTITSGQGPGVVLGQSIVKNFYLNSEVTPVVTEEKAGVQWYVWVIIVVVAIAIILWFVLKPKKKKK
jgi:hypothetical protein